MNRHLREALMAALGANSISETSDDLHSWRCSYRDIYGPCSCFEELLDDLVAAVRDAQESPGGESDAVVQG